MPHWHIFTQTYLLKYENWHFFVPDGAYFHPDHLDTLEERERHHSYGIDFIGVE